MYRTDIINELIKKNNYKSYLELGVCDGMNLRRINSNDKIGVDPEPTEYGVAVTNYLMTSDSYFFSNTRKFDIIFIDGLHEAKQVYKDINNALNILNEGGIIICHDMNPIEELHQRVPRQSRIWNGDCWKAWVQLRTERNNLEMFVVNTDWGCGVITKGEQIKLKVIEDITYENLVINRNKWLNLISVEDFKDKLK